MNSLKVVLNWVGKNKGNFALSIYVLLLYLYPIPTISWSLAAGFLYLITKLLDYEEGFYFGFAKELREKGYKTDHHIISSKLRAMKSNQKIMMSISQPIGLPSDNRSRRGLELRTKLFTSRYLKISDKNIKSKKFDSEILVETELVRLIEELFKRGNRKSTKIIQKRKILGLYVAFLKDEFGDVLEIVEHITELFKLLTSETIEKNMLEIKLDYRCHECNKIIYFEGKSCPYCDANAPICIICYSDPEPDEKISILLCCNSYGHTRHIRNWLESNSTCPYCQIIHPSIFNVSDIS